MAKNKNGWSTENSKFRLRNTLSQGRPISSLNQANQIPFQMNGASKQAHPLQFCKNLASLLPSIHVSFNKSKLYFLWEMKIPLLLWATSIPKKYLSFCNQKCLVPFYLTIRLVLDGENSFAPYRPFSLRQFYQIPSLTFPQGIHFFQDDSLPIWNFKSFFNILRDFVLIQFFCHIYAEDKWLYVKQFEIGYFVQVLTPFLRAIKSLHHPNDPSIL